MKVLLVIAATIAVCLTAALSHAACVSGCSPAPVAAAAPAPATPAPAASTTSISDKLIADLQAAQAIACNATTTPAGPTTVDPLGCSCYPVLVTTLQSLTPPGASGVVGPISAFEAGRVAVNGALAGIPLPVQEACGGLVMDVRLKALTLGGLVALLAPK